MDKMPSDESALMKLRHFILLILAAMLLVAGAFLALCTDMVARRVL